MTKGHLQRDGCTLLQASMVRYVESIFPLVRSIMEARPHSPVKTDVGGGDVTSVNWDETMVCFIIGFGVFFKYFFLRTV